MGFTPSDRNEDVELPVPVISKTTKESLEGFAPLLQDDFQQFKRSFLKWLVTEGKDPLRGEGYSDSTIRGTHYRIEKAYRWVWERNGEYKRQLEPEDATDYIRFLLKHSEKKDAQIYTCEKSLKRLFAYFEEATGQEIDWENPYDLKVDTGNKNLDYFKKGELTQLYEGALQISSVKSYDNKSMTSEERERLKVLLAQRLSKPKKEIGPEEFKKANSWKFPSLFAVTMDTGLRPIEVERSKISWVNLEDQELVIPKDESTKSPAPWECALSSRTCDALLKWLKERESYDEYRGRDALWLTKYGNPYNSNSLGSVLGRVLDETNIDERGRQLTWYSIRRAVATVWANEEGIHDAKEQLRHKSIDTTIRYVHSSSERRMKLADSKW